MATLASLASLEVSTAPLGTSTGGFTYTFDPLSRRWSRSASSFGPAFAERSLTTGRAKVSLGVNWLHSGYNSFNDQDLKNFDFQPAQNIRNFTPVPAASYSAMTLDMSSDTVVVFGHVGVTNRFDVGAAVPWIRFDMSGTGGFFSATGAQLTSGALKKTASSGIGDVAVFAKYQAWRHNDGGLAIAGEMRLPSGDKNAFRGLDVTRTMVSGIWSQGGKVSPHANVGYEFWSDEVPISADGTVFTKDQVKYAVGVEFSPHPLTTIVVDVVGRYLRHGGGVGYQTFTTGSSSVDALIALPDGLNQLSLAPGIKWNAWGTLLVTGNALFSLENNGLRANIIPVVGIDWAF